MKKVILFQPKFPILNILSPLNESDKILLWYSFKRFNSKLKFEIIINSDRKCIQCGRGEKRLESYHSCLCIQVEEIQILLSSVPCWTDEVADYILTKQGYQIIIFLK